MDRLIRIMENEFEEFHSTGKISRAKELSKNIKMHVNHNEYPSYFFGDPKAKFVLIHLNPKQIDNHSDIYEGIFKFTDFDDYFNFHRYYGKKHYSKDAARTQDTRFDSKQVRFIKPFSVINFDDTDDEYVNLEKVMDDKLQLELLPFGSNKFDSEKVSRYLDQSYIEILLDVISSQERDYVIFCGEVFETLLEKYIVSKKDYKFKLSKVNGEIACNNSNFSKIIIDFNGKKIPVGIARSFAQMGINMNEYGKKCSELYNL